MLKAVIFDMYETLITHFAVPLYFGSQIAKDAGIDVKDFREFWDPTGDARTLGKMTLEEALTAVFKGNGCFSEELLDRVVAKRIETKKECFDHLHEEIIPMLRGLKESGFKIGLITNCFSEEVDLIKESVLYKYFDAVMFSYEQGVKKPDPVIFERCMASLGVAPDECVYVGDGGANELERARELGMKVYQATWYFTDAASPPTGRNDAFPELSHPLELIEILTGNKENQNMENRKIVAIGGGENGRISKDGKALPYELEAQDREIIRLTGKDKPHFLMLAHSQPLEAQEGYFNVMQAIYGERFGCECRDLKSDRLSDVEYVKSLVDWADIIYEGGGNTLRMIALWKETGFDKILRGAWENGKVMCGVSAGAECWFSKGSSDSLSITEGEGAPIIIVDCLGLLPGLFIPHCDDPKRVKSTKGLLRESGEIGFSLSNCAALEIVGDKYRLITSDASYHGIKAYAKRSYWLSGVYVEEMLDLSDKFKPLNELYEREE
ncbi:MAG: HAD-IA family hydrolase [Clostridia bacterium]|nr:HAD-IA family hydrolase [Clostridia bacterium]